MINIKHSQKKNENHCNYLTPTKSTALKRLPTHSYNSFYQIQKQNLLCKFKDSEIGNNSINIKVNNNNNFDLNSYQKQLNKNSLYLPLLNKKGINNNCTINNEINSFRRPHRKSVEQKKTNMSICHNRNNNNENNLINEQKEKNDEDNLENNKTSYEPKSSLYKTKIKSCKQVRRSKKNLPVFKND